MCKRALKVALPALCLLATACGQNTAKQQVPGSIPSSTLPGRQGPSGTAGLPPPMPSRSQINDSYRWAYAMDTAQKAAQLGLILGGPFAAPASMGMGLLGLIYGSITAEAKIAEQDAKAQAQYQKEATKDQQLEAAIEKELGRQRDFENQIASAATPGAKDPAAAQLSQLPAPTRPVADAAPTAVASIPSSASAPAPSAPFKNVEVKDLNNDGIPDLWIYYDPRKAGEILRQEESSKGDGRVDTWSYFKDGQLVRRDVDNNGHGRPDTVFYYDGQNIVREERDETGQGKMTYRADYREGRLAKVEKDTHGHGRPDLWITYDSSQEGEVVLKEERDLDGDGLPDLWSHYEHGRLVRRDVNAVGLELLSTREALPLAGGEIHKIALPAR